jgi:hypothetical protein
MKVHQPVGKTKSGPTATVQVPGPRRAGFGETPQTVANGPTGTGHSAVVPAAPGTRPKGKVARAAATPAQVPFGAATPLVVTPRSGPAKGGNWVTVTVSGARFVGVPTVEFGGVASPHVVVLTPVKLRAVAPAHPPGPVVVSVVTGGHGPVYGVAPKEGAAPSYTYSP